MSESKAVDLAHGGHQGIRDKVWFPGIDKLAGEKVKNCLSCQVASTKSLPLEHFRMTPLPIAPWKEVAVDFAGLFPSSDYTMAVTYASSCLSDVEILTSTSAKAVILKLDHSVKSESEVFRIHKHTGSCVLFNPQSVPIPHDY